MGWGNAGATELGFDHILWNINIGLEQVTGNFLDTKTHRHPIFHTVLYTVYVIISFILTLPPTPTSNFLIKITINCMNHSYLQTFHPTAFFLSYCHKNYEVDNSRTKEILGIQERRRKLCTQSFGKWFELIIELRPLGFNILPDCIVNSLPSHLSLFQGFMFKDWSLETSREEC